MPVHSTPGGGKQWGHGKVYHGKNAASKAAAQGRAAFANGYRVDFQKQGPEQDVQTKKTRYVDLYSGLPADGEGEDDE